MSSPEPTTSPGTFDWNLSLLLSGQWISQMGNMCFTIAVYWMVLSATHSRADLGFIGAAAGAAGLFSLVSGTLVDMWDRRTTMIVTDLLRFLLLAGAFWLFNGPHVPVLVILFLVFAINVGGSLFSPAQYALMPEIAPMESLQTVNGLDQSATSLAQWMGYGVGGLAMAALGPAGLTGIDAVTFFVSALTLFGIRVKKRPPATHPHTFSDIATSILAGQRTLWAHPFLKRALPTALVVNLAMMTLTILDAAWAKQTLHGHASLYGLLEGAAVIGAIVGGLVATRLPSKWTLPRIIMSSLLVAGLAMLTMAAHPESGLSLGCLGVVGGSFGVLNATMNTTIQRAVPGEILGRIGGSLMAVSALATPVGALLAGWVGSLFPLPFVYGAAGALVVLMAAPFLAISDQFTAIRGER